jgi:demethylspheroidene O-methyltransferase
MDVREHTNWTGAGPSASAVVTWSDRWHALRDRLLASPRFQRWAAAFPLTRPLARRRARAVFDLCAGFVYSQVLLACVRLRLFEILVNGPQTAAALSAQWAMPLASTTRLLAAAVSLQLVEHRGSDRYGLGALGAALCGNPGVAALVEHHALLYADLRDPVALLRGERRDTALAGYWPYAGAERPATLADERVAQYSTLMSASQPLVAGEVLDAYPLGRHARLLDVGGGEGAFLSAAAARTPGLHVILFDLPPVAARARARFAAAGLAERSTVVGGDFLSDPLPGGADVASLVRVIHDHDDDAAHKILRAVRRALPAGGTLLLAEPMAATPGAEPVGDAYFGFYLLAMQRGRPRTPAELGEMLRSAGFARPRLLPTRLPLQTSLLVARAV